MHIGSIVSPLDSPSEGFSLPQWTPLSHDASVDDFIAAAAAEPLSRTSGLTSVSEVCLSPGISDTSSFSSRRLSKDTAIVAPPRPFSHLYRCFSRYCSSKLGSRRLFGRQMNDGISNWGSAVRRNRALPFENGLDFQETGDCSESRGKQSLTLSQLVASSTREIFRWSDVNSVSQLSWSLDEDGVSACMPLERIRAGSVQPDEDFESDVLEKCGLCSRGLLHRSPWSSQGYMGSKDLPVVGVLACGHAYHADCLEKSGSEISMGNPLCPQCVQLEKAALKAFMWRLDCAKHTIGPLKKQLATFLKTRSRGSVLKADKDLTNPHQSLTVEGKGALLKSLIKLQAPLQAKSRKVVATRVPTSRQ